MQEVQGQLGPGVVPDVLRHVEFLRESGRLVLLSDTRHGLVVVRAGRPVHAACRRVDGAPAHGIEALALLLSWETGTYRFEATDAGRSSTHEGGPAQVHATDSLAGSLDDLLDAAHARRGMNGRAHGAGEPRKDASVPKNGFHVPAAPRVADPPGSALPQDDPPLWDAPDADDDAAMHADVFLAEAAENAALGPDAVLLRAGADRTADDGSDGPRAEEDVALPRGALALWIRLDGVTPLAGWAETLGTDQAQVLAWAERLRRARMVLVAPEAVEGPDFLDRLTDELIDIMGPMGEILVDDAIDDLDLDPEALPVARVEELIEALAYQLPRSDWQMKFRARAARLRHLGPISASEKEA